jgi:hypothetical protein
MIDFPASPTVGQVFDTPTFSYTWNGTSWIANPPGTANSGSGIHVGDNPPTDPVAFPMWWNSTNLQLFVWYTDADSSQWVAASADSGGGGGGGGSSGGIADAPSDGVQYGRQDAAWTPISTDIRFPDGTALLPGIAWEQDTSFGWKRETDGIMSLMYRGESMQIHDCNTFGRFELMGPFSLGSYMVLHKGLWAAVDDNKLEIWQNSDGSASIKTTINGAAVRGNLNLDAPAILSTGSITLKNQISVNASADPNWAVLTLNSAPTSGTAIEGKHASSQRWGITMPDSTPEGGGNTGSNFGITRYDDTGTWLGQSFAIDRATGNVTAQGLTTVAELSAESTRITELTGRLETALERVDDLTSKLEAALARISKLEGKY